jgi:hypothetical protein
MFITGNIQSILTGKDLSAASKNTLGKDGDNFGKTIFKKLCKLRSSDASRIEFRKALIAKDPELLGYVSKKDLQRLLDSQRQLDLTDAEGALLSENLCFTDGSHRNDIDYSLLLLILGKYRNYVSYISYLYIWYTSLFLLYHMDFCVRIFVYVFIPSALSHLNYYDNTDMTYLSIHYTYIHMYIHIYVYTYIYICLYMYIYLHTYIHKYIHSHDCQSTAEPVRRTQVAIAAGTAIVNKVSYISVNICIYIYIYMYI